MRRLSPLEGIRVVTEDGSRLGRIFEIRSPGKAESEPTYSERRIDCLLCGRRGLLERLGWREPDAHTVRWNAVIAIRDRDILVRGSAQDHTRLQGFRPEAT
jgi:sporulation protein YlmC with PRC-barrel domain